MRTLEGKVAVLTGSSGMIGQTTARMLAEVGASVVLGDLVEPAEETVSPAIRAGGGQAVYQRTDVRSPEAMKALAALAVEKFGRLDIWINNAGMNNWKRLTELEPDQWDQVIDVCLKGAYLGAKYAIPLMIQTGGGCIINMASVHSRLSSTRTPAYDAAKAGLVALTRQIALDYGPDGIRANAILPGMVRDTPWRSRFGRDKLAKYRKLYPLRRIGRTADVGAAVIYLASDAASFVTGASLVVDGGMTTRLAEDMA